MNFKTKIISSYVVIIFVLIVANLIVYNKLVSAGENVERLNHESFKSMTLLLEADRDAYQSNLSLLRAINDNRMKDVDAFIKSGVYENLQQTHDRFKNFQKLIESHLTDKSTQQFDNFFQQHAKLKKETDTMVAMVKSSSYFQAQKYYVSDYLGTFEGMRGVLDKFTAVAYDSIEKDYNEALGLLESSKEVLSFQLLSVSF